MQNLDLWLKIYSRGWVWFLASRSLPLQEGFISVAAMVEKPYAVYYFFAQNSSHKKQREVVETGPASWQHNIEAAWDTKATQAGSKKILEE